LYFLSPARRLAFRELPGLFGFMAGPPFLELQ
jgi:hypothetical protein